VISLQSLQLLIDVCPFSSCFRTALLITGVEPSMVYMHHFFLYLSIQHFAYLSTYSINKTVMTYGARCICSSACLFSSSCFSEVSDNVCVILNLLKLLS
jgi:hypothetical protein